MVVNNSSEESPYDLGIKCGASVLSNGYLINFEMHQGANPRYKPNYEFVFGKCSAPMILFLAKFSSWKRALPYNLFIDNLFMGQNLLAFLQYCRLSGTGTSRKNRIEKGVLTTKKNFEKHPGGSIEAVMEKSMESYTLSG